MDILMENYLMIWLEDRLPAQMRATVEERFHMSANMVAATAFLWLHVSQPSLNLSNQNLPAINLWNNLEQRF